MATSRNKKRDFTFIDLFAGIGGFHQAMKSLGGKCVFASEIDKNCQKTYSNQFNIEVHGDINNYIQSIPSFDVLCGGFPCQTFSKAGKQMGFEDEVRGKLFFRIVDILKLHPECKFIMLENVRNLADDANFWNVIQKKLQELDFYVTKEPLIKSPDEFGIPQNRERVYILGIKKELRDISKIHNEWIDLKEIDLSPEYKKCIDKTAFSILDLNNPINKDYIITNEEKQIINAWEELKKTILPHNQIGTPIWLDFFGFNYDEDHDNQYYNDCNYNNMPQWKQKFVSRNRTFYLSEKKKIDAWYKKYKDILTKKIYRKFEWNCGPEYQDFKNCIIQFRQSGLRIKRSDKFPSLVAIINTPIIWDSKLKEYRRLTIREAANLQSFDPNYKFICEDHSTYKQLGNSVNVKVIKIIAEKLFNLAVPNWENKS